ncbi:MAG TPA: gluconate 2-dehydrogenase subunit 3 family protein [Verrucomicrobiae bacterium]|nr:gluconate 2-dehydrogenase subunit 3 family protein [Verrucomicrobiae bacterium]
MDESESRAAPLTAAEVRLLEAIAERIFPATDTPGAVEIGAVDYILRALAGDYADMTLLYHRGLEEIDRCAVERFGCPFVKLNDENMNMVLADFEAGRAPFEGAADFFETVRCHVLEGVFGEPEYGGNRGLAGWRIVDFPGQQHGYPDAYVNRRVDLPPMAAQRKKEDE